MTNHSPAPKSTRPNTDLMERKEAHDNTFDMKLDINLLRKRAGNRHKLGVKRRMKFI